MLVPPLATIASIALISSGASPLTASTCDVRAVEKVMSEMRSPGLEAVEHALEALAGVLDRLALHRAAGVDDEAQVERRALELARCRSVVFMPTSTVMQSEPVIMLPIWPNRPCRHTSLAQLGVRQLELVLVEEADVVDGVRGRGSRPDRGSLELAEVLRAALADAEALSPPSPFVAAAGPAVALLPSSSSSL
jgi:hypothetical protein